MNMDELIKKLVEFHGKFDISVGKTPFPNVPKEQQLLYYDLLIEEVIEFKDAVRASDNIAIADAFGDIMFVLFSAIVENGLQDVIEDIFNEICDSNSTKLDTDGKPKFREDGKIMKCEGYRAPRLNEVFKKHNIIIKT